MIDVIRFRRGRDEKILHCEMRVSAGGTAEDGLIERADRFMLEFCSTAETREFFSDISGMTAEAQRSMPGRLLSVKSITPNNNRTKTLIACEG